MADEDVGGLVPATPRGLTPRRDGSQSARGETIMSATGMQITGASPISTWSQVAKYSVRQEQIAEQQRRQKLKDAQSDMRSFLDQQMAAKNAAKKQEKDEELKMLEFQAAELQRFQANESREQEQRKAMAMELKQSRLQQVELQKAKRKEEREQRLEEGKRVVQLAQTEIELEKQFEKEKKKSQQRAMAKLADAWVKEKAEHLEEKKKQTLLERQQIKDYQDMLDRAEIRKREEMKRMVAHVEVAKALPDVPTGAEVRAKAQKEDNEADVRLAEQVRQVNLERLHKEVAKEEDKKERLLKNREELHNQMVEQRRLQEEAKELKKRQKLEALSANLAYIEGEKHRIEQCRMKNIQHKVELEKQIELRRTRPKVNEDELSHVEAALNKKLVTAASGNPEAVSA